MDTTAMQPGWYPDQIDPTVQRFRDGNAWTAHVARDGATWELPLPSAPAETKKRTRRVPIWVWILIALIALIPLLLLAPLVAPLALAVLITGIVALVKGTPTWSIAIGSRSRCPWAVRALRAAEANEEASQP